MNTRRDCLEALLRYERSPREIAAALKAFGWDAEDELVTLARGHVCGVLCRFTSDRLSAADVEHWANVVEGREDIGLETGYEALLLEVIFELANPLLHEPLTKERADRLLARL